RRVNRTATGEFAAPQSGTYGRMPVPGSCEGGERHPLKHFSQFIAGELLPALWLRVHQSKSRVRPATQDSNLGRGLHPLQDVDPQLDVPSLQRADGVPVVLRQAVEVAVLHPDDIGVGEGEPHVELDESAEGEFAIRCSLDDRGTAMKQL